jgi:hypothetical protein
MFFLEKWVANLGISQFVVVQIYIKLIYQIWANFWLNMQTLLQLC